jgi:hypothetical protein
VQQEDANTEQVVKVGLALIHELGERLKRLEVEVDMYREMIVALATTAGVDVPAFVREESGSLGESQGDRVGQLRAWLEEVSSVFVAGEEQETGVRSRSRRGGGRSARGKQPRGGSAMRGS